jgi:hypothetical protein
MGGASSAGAGRRSARRSINLVVFGLSGPFSAALVERIGVRRVVTIALCARQ